MKWFLIWTSMVYPPCNGIDCGISPSYRATPEEHRMEMPSLEVCRAVRAVNAGSKCIIEDVDTGDIPKSDKRSDSGSSSPWITTIVPGTTITVTPEAKPN